ncbi:MAG: M3 family metallopeptidase [Chthoniobacterales bacterium]
MQFLIAETSPAANRKTPTRAEVASTDTWDLTPLFPDDAAWETEFQSLQADYPGITEFRGHLGESVETLHRALEFEKSIDLRIESLNQYVALRTTEDSSDSGSLAREARFQSALVHLAEAFSFLAPELQAIDDATFDAWLQEPLLADWQIQLKKLRRLKPHTLSPSEERLLALASGALSGHQETFSQLTNVDMKFGSITDAEGREIELTQSSFSSLLNKKDPAIRREAFHKFYDEFSDHKFTLASSLASSVRTDVFQSRARNYPSAREAALFRDDVPVSVYDNLITAVRSKLPVLHRYYALRKRILGLDEIHHYDTYVPLVSEIETDIPWDGAVDRVLSAVRPLGDDYVATLGHGLRDGRWCDRYENQG